MLQESIQAELRKVRARADFEAAYLRRIAERRAQCEARAQALRADVASRCVFGASVECMHVCARGNACMHACMYICMWMGMCLLGRGGEVRKPTSVVESSLALSPYPRAGPHAMLAQK